MIFIFILKKKTIIFELLLLFLFNYINKNL